MNTKILVKHAVLLSSVIAQALCADINGAMRDNLFLERNSHSSEEKDDSDEDLSTTTERDVKSSTVYPYNPYLPWSNFSTAKIVTLFLISFSIPIIFMLLLFWRLQREKKFLNARAGALVYRETVLVPSYTLPENTDQSANDFNVVQMHTALYDTPPDYDEVTRCGLKESEATKSKEVKIEDIPPPAYSTVYM